MVSSRQSMKASAALAVIFLLAGCLQDAPAPPGNSTPSTTSASVSTTPSPTQSPQAPVEPDFLHALDLSGCDGFTMSIYGPSSLFSPAVPSGWESENLPVTRIVYFLFHCAHASFGPFERPATFLLEASDAISPPEACVAMDYLFFFESLWVDDPDIAAYANSTYGLPTRLTTFTRQNTTAGGLSEVVWIWDAGNGANAEVHGVDLPGTFYQGSPIINRFFWSNGVGVSYWDWHEDYQDDLVSVRDGYGSLPPPTLYGKSESPDNFAAPFGFLVDGAVHAPIQSFGDFECKKPL